MAGKRYAVSTKQEVIRLWMVTDMPRWEIAKTVGVTKDCVQKWTLRMRPRVAKRSPLQINTECPYMPTKRPVPTGTEIGSAARIEVYRQRVAANEYLFDARDSRAQQAPSASYAKGDPTPAFRMLFQYASPRGSAKQLRE